MNLQESIRRILREESDKVMNMQSKILSQFRKQDQMERNEYSKFVQSEFGGDYERGAKEYAKIKNRNSDDIFGDKKRIREFILINFDFNTFSSKDWENYWLLSQHSDNHPEFQKKALNIIKQNLGEDNEYYEYLHDRISCRESGTQIYGTQNICKKSKMNLQESIRRILREELNNYDIVYRGQPEDEYDISPRNSIWVTYDYDFANLYGRVKEYKLPKNLNILDTDYYVEWESLVDEFDEYGDNEEYKYEPTDEFILFLESKGYDGFINGDNILIFNKNKLFK